MKYKLVCFDVDGTLIDNVVFSWELFHDYFKTDKKKRAEARDNFFAGKITYEEWAKHDIELWKKNGANKTTLKNAVSSLKIMNGAVETINKLKDAGLKLAVISGSIDIIPETIIHGFNEMFSDVYLNRLSYDPKGEITGIKITDFDIEGKAIALKHIAKRENVKLTECVFIGDHVNDIAILKEAGLGIAFDPKDESLAEVSDVVIREKDLRLILPYILDS